eukprot:gnl/TRDRNA2_/TRDRNA2_125350_c1_seq3.p1 gnl/TRDRNA2_/TRDRNA2_125350_c1~~gnl/TRDRNA2_/TRDRNA2_125350_c1_seq3.p1  ORF type:complete len:104 (-),score=8.89 gnl/TRDRNA2_/TRDRNA2_125350_c1_seq3:155-466(-)
MVVLLKMFVGPVFGGLQCRTCLWHSASWATAALKCKVRANSHNSCSLYWQYARHPRSSVNIEPCIESFSILPPMWLAPGTLRVSSTKSLVVLAPPMAFSAFSG